MSCIRCISPVRSTKTLCVIRKTGIGCEMSMICIIFIKSTILLNTGFFHIKSLNIVTAEPPLSEQAGSVRVCSDIRRSIK